MLKRQFVKQAAIAVLILQWFVPPTPQAYAQIVGTSAEPIQSPHAGSIVTLSVSPSGQYLLSGSEDRTVKLWDLTAGRLVRTLRPGQGVITSAVFAADGTQIAVANNAASVWDVNSGGLIQNLGAGRYWLSPDGKSAISNSDQLAIEWWDVGGAKRERLSPQRTTITTAAFSARGDRLVTDSASEHGQELWVWDARAKTVLRRIKVSDAIRIVAVSATGDTIVTGTANGFVEFRNANTGALIRKFKAHANELIALALSPDGKRILSGGSDKAMKLWNAASGALLRSFDGHNEPVTAVTFAADGRLVSGSDAIRIFADNGSLLNTLSARGKSVLAATFVNDGTQVIARLRDGTVRLWMANTGELLRTGPTAAEANSTTEHYRWEVHRFAFSPDGARLAGQADNRSLKVWDVATGQTILSPSNSVGVASVAFSPDGTRVLTGHDDTKVRLLDAGTGRLLQTIDANRNNINCVAFAADGETFVVVGGDEKVRIWNANTGELLRALEITPSVAAPKIVEIPRLSLDRLDDLISDGNLPYNAVAIASGARRVISVRQSAAAQLWDGRSGQPLAALRGHSRPITAVAFSADGTIAATASEDRTIRLWDAASGRLLKILEGHDSTVGTVMFSPDNQRVVSGSEDTTVRVWSVATGQFLATLPTSQ